jgi:CHAT domain-containing protein
VLIASGPDLPAAAAESRAVAALYDNVTRLGLREANVERVIEELGHVQLAHLVAHGDFRSDNPLFSSLSLADGPLTVYDLERASRLPAVVVLSACNAGIPGVRPGNETMGIVAGLLGAGVRTVVASAGLVPDSNATKRTMLEFHRRLAGGERPAAALAAAVARSAAAGPAGFAEAGFVCFGAG